jgi:hypothetical protein
MSTPVITPEQQSRAIDAIAENGRVLATLDDWRAIAFVLVIVMLVLVAIIVVLLRATRQERKDMSEERSRMWAVADKFGAAADKLTVELQVQAALSARVESALGRCEEIHNAATRATRPPSRRD